MRDSLLEPGREFAREPGLERVPAEILTMELRLPPARVLFLFNIIPATGLQLAKSASRLRLISFCINVVGDAFSKSGSGSSCPLCVHLSAMAAMSRSC